MAEQPYYEQKSRALDMLLSVAPYVVGGLVINEVGKSLGLWESTADTKGGAKFRALPFLYPEFATDVFKGWNHYQIITGIFDSTDMYRLEKAKKTLSTTYYSKGYIWDDETAAINSLKSLIKSKIDFSIFSVMFLDYVKDDMVSYLDTYLENRFQRELYKWAVKLPLLTVKEVSTLQKKLGRSVKIKGDKLLIGKKS